MSEKTIKKRNALQRMGSIFTRVLLAIAIVLAVLELFLHRHGVAAVEDTYMFPAIFGFLAFGFIVEVGKWLRLMIMRSEDYYKGDESDD